MEAASVSLSQKPGEYGEYNEIAIGHPLKYNCFQEYEYPQIPYTQYGNILIGRTELSIANNAKGVTNMSFTYAHMATDGIVIASDTRRTLHKSNGETAFYENEQKIFPIKETNILAVLTGCCRFGEKQEQTLVDILGQLRAKTIEGIYEELENYFIKNPPISKALVCLYQPVENQGIVEVRRIFLVTGEKSETKVIPQIFADPNTTFQQGEKWANEFSKKFPVEPGSIESIVPQVKEIVSKVIAATAFLPVKSQNIGGSCDVYIANLLEAKKL